MQRTRLLFFAGGTLLAASLCGNLYFAFRAPAMASAPRPSAADQSDSAPKIEARNPDQAQPLHFNTIRYQEYDKTFILEFSGNESTLLGTDKAPVEVSPAVPCTWAILGDTIRIHGEFAPETRYNFRVFAGLSDLKGGNLEREIVVSGKTPRVSPALAFAAKATYLPINTPKLELIYTATNVGKIKATLSRAFVNNLNAYFFDGYSARQRMATVTETTIEPAPAPANRPVHHALNLESMLPARTPGFYRLDLADAADPYGNTASCDIVLTDLAPIATLDEPNGKAAIFLRRFSNGAPVANARISLLSFKNQTAGTAVTDDRGYAEISFSPSFDRRNDHITGLLATSGGDLTFFNFNRPHDAKTLRAPTLGQPSAFLFTERDIVRPGENVRVSLFLRERAEGESRPVANRPAVLTVRDPNGKVFLKKLLHTDQYGYAAYPVELPADALTGSYRIVCGLSDKEVWGDSSLLCAMYVPDRIKAELRRAPGMALPNQPVAYQLRANYYFGTALDKGNYTFQVTAAPGANPAHWPKDWSVGDSAQFKEPQTFEQKGMLENGSVVLEYPGFGPRGGVSFRPVRLIAQAATNEPGGRGVTATDTAMIYPTDWFIALREAPKSYNGEWGFGIRLVSAEPLSDAALRSEAGIHFRLFRIDWVYVLADDNGKLVRSWREKRTPVAAVPEPIHLNAGLKLADYEQTFRFGPEKPLANGQYELVAESADGTRRTAMTFWHDRGESGVRSANPAVLAFRTDREKYLPGEIARLTFDAPVAGEGFLIAGERGIENHLSFPVNAGENTVPVPIPADMESSVLTVGITTAGRNGTEFSRSFGQALIPVDQAQRRRLEVGIAAPDRARPGETAEATITLSGADGKPQSGRVAIFAVDEGVLALTGYRTPDIFEHFFGQLGGALQFYDVYGMVYPELRILPDGRIGGDGGKAIGAKRGDIKFKKIARVLLDAVTVPASGQIRVALPLPEDHTGALRLMAVAANERMVGSAERPILLRDEIGVMLAAPRFLAPGDEAELVFTLFNHDREGKSYRFAAILPPTLEPVSGDAVLQGELAKGASLRHKIRVRATRKLGADAILWKFQMGNLAKNGSEFVTVRGVNVHQTRTRFAMLKNGQSGDFTLNPAKWEPGAKGIIRVSGSPALGLTDALDWLNRYPYGCLEQVTAAAFPLLIADDLAAGGVLSPEMREACRPKIPLAYQRLLGMQLTSGGFAMWRGDTEEWRFGSLFAAHFIREAIAKQLLRDDPAVTRPLRKFLCRIADDASAANRMNRAYACYILALAGDEAAANPARNLISARENDYATLLASLALLRKGYAAEAAAPLKAALDAQVWNQSAMPFDCDNLSSRLGMTLYLLLSNNAAPPELAAELALRLGSAIKPDGSGWGTTQSNGWAALGLGAYAALHPAEPIQATCRRGENPPQALAGDVSEQSLTEQPLTVTNRSRHPLLIQQTVTGIPAQPPVSGGALKLTKSYLDAKGNRLERVAHGDAVFVELQVESPETIDNAVIADLLPAGLEIEDERLATRSAVLPKAIRERTAGLSPRMLERGDDRFLIFGTIPQGRSRFLYRTRAVMRGKFTIPPLQAEAMYRPEINGVFHPGQSLEVR